MNPQRPVWCPTKTCTCLHRLQDKICAGMPGELGRVCVNFKTVGGAVFAYDNVNTGDVQSLRDLVDAIDDQLVARGERGTDDSRDGGGTTPRTAEVEQRKEQLPRAPSGTGAE